MPIKLVPPRAGKSPNWTFRGAHLGVHVDKSSGTDRRSLARQQLKRLIAAIERGDYPRRETARRDEPTFLSADIAYMEAGGERRYVNPLIRRFGETLLADIDQTAIDDAALALRPHAGPATRNRCVYTPAQAILRHAGVDLRLRRPKGAKGRIITDALTHADAAAVIAAADRIDPEYAALLRFLLYTGCRLGEALALRWDDVRIEERAARIRTSKNGDPRELRLREDVCVALAALPRRNARVFRFHQGGNLKHKLTRAKLKALGLPCPKRRPTGWRQPPNRLSWLNHHSFCHTRATWMRRYGGADVQGLVETRRWRDAKSAARYAHAVAREEWSRVDSLPAIGGKSVESHRKTG
jgi:integrase